MKIVTEIFKQDSDCTVSKLYIDGVYQCFVMEDAIRDTKIYGRTAIPRGTYKVVVTMSNRFKTLLPLLENVPNYSGVRIHPGNTSADTEGCLLPGLSLGKLEGKTAVLESRPAFAKIFRKIQEAIANGEKITIELK